MKISYKTSRLCHMVYANEIYDLIAAERTHNHMGYHSIQEIYQQIICGDAIIAIDTIQNTLVGFAASRKMHPYREIGSLVVKKAYRNRGYGQEILQKTFLLAQKEYAGEDLLILANPISSQIAKHLDMEICDKTQLDQRFRELCKNCKDKPKYPICRCESYVSENMII